MKHHIGETNEMSETPSVCPFCGSYVATLDDGKPCGDSEGNWVAFRCLTSWHGGYHDPRKLQSKTCETVERHKLYDRIKRLEEAVEAYRTAYTPDGHVAPHDCFATGPKTGNPIEDLVACPGCWAERKAKEAKL